MNHSSAHGCIFVVDDNRDFAEMLTLLLEMDGYHVHTFFNGTSALDAAPTLHPAAGILDIEMPVMNGLELAKGMRSALPKALLVAYSAREVGKLTSHGHEQPGLTTTSLSLCPRL